MARNVLIVDDNEHLRQILSSLLGSTGYDTLEAATGSEAVSKAIAAKPDLILLDLSLPDMRGTEVAQAIKRNSTSAHIPIIGCSAFLSSEARTEALRAGMVDYLVKPISLEVIKTKIDEFILAER